MRLLAIGATAALAVLAATALLLTPTTQPVVAQGPPAVAKLPADLALIPGDAIGFMHVRLADVWKSDAMKDMRTLVAKAGPKAFAILDADFHPAPSTIDRVTIILLPMKDKADQTPRLVSVVSFSAAFDAAKIRKMYMPKAEEMKVEGKTYYLDKALGMALHFPSDQLLVLSDPDNLPIYLALPAKSEGIMQSAIALAATKSMTVCLNYKGLPIPPDTTDRLPPELRPLLRTEQLLITADVGQQVTLNLNLAMKNADDAKEIETAIKKAAEMGREMLKQPLAEATRLLEGKNKRGEGPRPLEELPQAVGGLVAIAGINSLDELLADLPIKRDGANLGASITLPAWATQYVGTAILGTGLLIPAVQKVRGAAARTTSMNNLKQIGIAMHSYHDANRAFPPAAICDKNGKKLLSWRVAILPYIEQQNLYAKFKLDEPWDSEANKKAAAIMPKTYSDPRQPEVVGKTHYRVFVGKDAAFDWVKGKSITDFTDGLSNSILVVAGGEPVDWAKPDDFEFDPEKKLPDIIKPFPDLLVGLADGSIRSLRTDRDDFQKLLKTLITINGGEAISID